MMEVFGLILLSAFICHVSAQSGKPGQQQDQLSSRSLRDAINKVWESKASVDCIGRESGATKEDVELFLDGGMPTTRPQKCLASCLGRHFGIVRFQSISLGHKLRCFVDISSSTKTTR